MSIITIRHLCFLFLVLFTPLIALAQTGSIIGTVKDAVSDETIIGANVVIEGTQLGASTDMDGNFAIRNLKPGQYNLVITFVSYKTTRVENLTVEAGKTVSVSTTLEEESITLSGVEITAERITNTEISVISEIKLSNQVVSGISAESIAKSQDSDAAQVVRRVPGVTIIDNRFVLIRGTSERYNPAMLHNVFAPSMETDVRAFSFDIIPSSQLDRMLVYKSPAPELPGDFAGGVIKIFTKGIPEEKGIVLDYSTGYRVGTHFKNFSHQKRGSGSFLGLDQSNYDLPGSFPADLRQINDNNQLVTAARSLNNNLWVAEEEQAMPDQKLSLTINNRFGFKSLDIGNTTAILYSNSRASFDVSRADFNAFSDGQSVPIYNYNDDQYNQNIRLGILHNWTFRFGSNHVIEFKNLFNRLSNSQYVKRTGRNFESFYSPVNHSFDKVYRGIYSGQLLGRHSFNGDKTKLDWVVGYGRSERDQPDYKRYRSDIVDFETNATQLYVPVGAAAAEFFGRFFSYMNETSYSGSFDVTHTFGTPGSGTFVPEIKVGAFLETKDRSFRARNIGYIRASSVNFNIDLLDQPISVLFRDENINNTTGIRIDEQSNPNDNYTASNDLRAGYAMLTLPFTQKIKFIGGVRVENNIQRLNSFTQTNDPIRVENNITRLLPSGTFSYNFTDNMLVRLAYGQTLNRPEFRELAPFGFYDFNFNFTVKGDPNLRTALIHNFDLRWEIYPTVAEIFSFGVFYKQFEDPIESIAVFGAGSGGAKPITFGNAESAYSYGVELDIRKSLTGMTGSGFVDKLGLTFNGALIRSRVSLGALNVGQSDNRPLQGQSPYVINTGLYYDDLQKGLQVNVNYNVIGRRIFLVGFFGFPDVYEMPRNLLDVTVRKNITDKFSLKVGVSDIFNQQFQLLQDGNQDGKFNRDTDQTIQSFRPGTVFSAGISYKLL